MCGWTFVLSSDTKKGEAKRLNGHFTILNIQWLEFFSVHKVPVCTGGGAWSRRSDSDPEHALTQLKAEQTTVGEAQGGAGCLGEVAGKHGLGTMPGPSAAAKLPDVVKARTCARRKHQTYTFKYWRSFNSVCCFVSLTCVQVSHHVDAGSDGNSAVDEGWAGLDAQVLVIEEHPPAHVPTTRVPGLMTRKSICLFINECSSVGVDFHNRAFKQWHLHTHSHGAGKQRPRRNMYLWQQ